MIDDHKRLDDFTIIVVTLCATLFFATVGIIGLMAMGVNVAKEVSLAVAAEWGGLLAFADRMRRKGGHGL